MPEPLATAIFAFVGLLFVGLAQPFIRRAVPPNRLSGLRVRATFADPDVWYEANAATGRDLARFGGAVLVAALVLPWVAGRHAVSILAAGVALGALVVAAVGTARANRMLAAREAGGHIARGRSDAGRESVARTGGAGGRDRRLVPALLLLAAVAGSPRALAAQQAPGPPEVLLRLDDVGMNHAVNQAVEKVAATGMPFSVSLLFACPWYQEAVEILKKHPHVTVGVHLALNSEWRGFRWGPVLGTGGVPSLVDSVGYFHASSGAFLRSRYDLAEVERELSAQVERALASGLKITYVDAHMGTAEATPQLREVTERVARKYGLGISTYYGESYYTLWGVPVPQKTSALMARLSAARRDAVNLIEVHVAERTPEMEVIVDMNAPSQNAPGAGVVDHRKAELEAMLSPELAALVRSGAIRLVTYAELVARAGAAGMRRPQ